MEQDDLVQAVEEFGAEMPANHFHHLVLDIGDLLIVAEIGEELAAKVAGQDDQRVREIHHAALPVGQAAVIQHLQQHVEDVIVRLLDLIEQDYLIGAPAHSLGQHAAFFIADITRRCTDQAGDRMFLHELAHVDAHHRALVIEHELGQGLGQLRLAHARGAEKQERS